ncbi:MAG TPA: DUF1996 domain-containing protein [Caldimonas sp.]|jgi:hypothetical protein|nr:DUF1996 domain-containing protein [Caldimonas sp.]HEX2542201.1 DUF1996 domain-containing protein [Caldimonas sp.]
MQLGFTAIQRDPHMLDRSSKIRRMELCLTAITLAVLTACGGGDDSADVEDQGLVDGEETSVTLSAGGHTAPLGRKIRDPHRRDGGTRSERIRERDPVMSGPTVQAPTRPSVVEPVAPVIAPPVVVPVVAAPAVTAPAVAAPAVAAPPMAPPSAVATPVVVAQPVIAQPPAPAPVWVTVASEGQSFSTSAPTTVRYGANSISTTRTVSGPAMCSNGFFGSDPIFGVAKSCQVLSSAPAPAPAPVAPTPVPPPVTVAAAPAVPTATTSLLPKVDVTNLPVPQPGISTPLLSPPGAIPALPAAGDWEHEGAFRLLCNWSKMSFDDPIVYPGRPGAAHHHTFFGNTAIDAFTTTENIRSKGNATCRGGTVNMSAYWVPSMIDTTTNRPLAPVSLLIYYKTGQWPYMNDNSVMRPLPKGLKMIAGDPSRSTPGQGQFQCFMPAVGQTRNGTGGPSIPTCMPGDTVRTHINFPQCWDGVNLDSPDHKSHMAFPENFWTGNPYKQWRCPLSHPVVLPLITFIVDYAVTAGAATNKWRLASDSYDVSKPGGYSLHADWMNGWDPVVSDLWGIKCMREQRDCGSANLGDGRSTLEFQGN